MVGSIERLLLRPEEFGEVLGVSRTEAYRLIREGEIAVVRVGKSKRVAMETVREFVAERVKAAQMSAALVRARLEASAGAAGAEAARCILAAEVEALEHAQSEATGRARLMLAKAAKADEAAEAEYVDAERLEIEAKVAELIKG